MQDIIKRLSTDFAATQKEGYIEVPLPVVINTSFDLVTLRIYQQENGYVITHPEDIFSEMGNATLEFYFNLFKKHNNNCYYGVELKNGILTKECKNNYNIAVAISDFIRFMIYFDDFFTNNGVIGNEESFE